MIWRRVLEHVLIWCAAAAIIVLGMGWAYALGFTTHRPHLRILAVAGATAVCIFAAALVQRSPAAVTLLVALCTLLVGLGVALLADGTAAAGMTYVIVGATYVATLGPSCLRWLTGTRS